MNCYAKKTYKYFIMQKKYIIFDTVFNIKYTVKTLIYILKNKHIYSSFHICKKTYSNYTIIFKYFFDNYTVIFLQFTNY